MEPVQELFALACLLGPESVTEARPGQATPCRAMPCGFALAVRVTEAWKEEFAYKPREWEISHRDLPSLAVYPGNCIRRAALGTNASQELHNTGMAYEAGGSVAQCKKWKAPVYLMQRELSPSGRSCEADGSVAQCEKWKAPVHEVQRELSPSGRSCEAGGSVARCKYLNSPRPQRVWQQLSPRDKVVRQARPWRHARNARPLVLKGNDGGRRWDEVVRQARLWPYVRDIRSRVGKVCGNSYCKSPSMMPSTACMYHTVFHRLLVQCSRN
eukprot:366548-Chlamydomonas_euryale.AAC.14